VDVYTTEDEQVEAIKKWWKENWLSLVGGVLIGIGILFGGKYWIDTKNYHAAAASMEYEAMVQSMAQNKTLEAETRAASLLGQYADTPYAAFAALSMAKIKTEADDLVAAKSHLRWVLDNSGQEELTQEALIRLARIYLAENNYDDALAQLKLVKSDKHKIVIEELKGDIYVAKGETENARTAYSMALAEMDLSADNTSSRLRNFLQMKIDDLGGSPIPQGEPG
jgi:predicted negative regulator of RcsB-dependent stress response